MTTEVRSGAKVCPGVMIGTRPGKIHPPTSDQLGAGSENREGGGQEGREEAEGGEQRHLAGERSHVFKCTELAARSCIMHALSWSDLICINNFELRFPDAVRRCGQVSLKHA